MKRCKFNGIAICRNVEERKIFSHIYQKLYPPIQICDKALYQITNYKGEKFIIENLKLIKGGDNRECFIIDIYTGQLLFLNEKNFSVVCPLSGDECECSKEEVVLKYTPQKKERH